jgi:uncharacterized damage-inducible protein DinB
MNTADRYRRWFEYEKDTHAKVLAALNSVPAPNRSAPTFQRALDILAHIVMARRLWLFRFGAVTEPPRDLFPQRASLEDLPTRIEEMESIWTGYLSRIDDAELGRSFEYRSLDAGWFRNTVEDILTQLHGHSLYHRGQIASLVRASGGEPAATDFVFWAREAIPSRDLE